MDKQDTNGKAWYAYLPERCGAVTDKGPRRAENQDTFWIPDDNTPVESGALYLVADGVGGQQDGAIASKLAAETVRQAFYDLRRHGGSVASALQGALEKANQVIQEEAQKREVRKMGSTFVAAVQDGDQLMVAHVGDARAYLVRQGKLRQLTRDDTWVQRQVDEGLLTEDEAARHEFRNVVTQVLGNKPEITINLSQSRELEPGDAILLCTDGLYDVLPDGRMISLINENTPQQAAQLLVEAAIEAEATDNITAVVMRTGGFVPLADEPTLAPLPVAVETTAAAAAPAAIESAPTIMTAAPSLSSPAAAKEQGGISKWLIIMAIVAVLLIAGALLAFWLQNRSVVEDSQDAAATALPEIVESPTADSVDEAGPVDAMATVPLPTATDEPQPTATSTVLPDTPTPRPTELIETAGEQRGCTVEGNVLFVWADVDDGCGPTPLFLRLGDEVQILEDPPKIPGQDCGPGQFIRIQSISNPLATGWVHEEIIASKAPGENCSP